MDEWEFDITVNYFNSYYGDQTVQLGVLHITSTLIHG